MTNVASDRVKGGQTLLRRALQANATFSTISGIAFALGAKPIAHAIGLEPWPIMLAIGVGLLIFAAGLFRNASRENINRIEAVLTVAGDFAWVIGSGIVILLGILNTSGNWATAIIADIVLLFAILQWIGLRHAAR
jgi:hypothetical protein